MSEIRNVVHDDSSHTTPTKEMVNVKKRKRTMKPPEVEVRCVGERKEPSKEALDRFIEIYVRMVKENEKRRKQKEQEMKGDNNENI